MKLQLELKLTPPPCAKRRATGRLCTEVRIHGRAVCAVCGAHGAER